MEAIAHAGEYRLYLDGTLVDSAPDLQHCTNILMEEMSLPTFDLPTVTGFIGHGVGPLVDSALKINSAEQSGADLATVVVPSFYTGTGDFSAAHLCRPSYEDVTLASLKCLLS